MLVDRSNGRRRFFGRRRFSIKFLPQTRTRQSENRWFFLKQTTAAFELVLVTFGDSTRRPVFMEGKERSISLWNKYVPFWWYAGAKIWMTLYVLRKKPFRDRRRNEKQKLLFWMSNERFATFAVLSPKYLQKKIHFHSSSCKKGNLFSGVDIEYTRSNFLVSVSASLYTMYTDNDRSDWHLHRHHLKHTHIKHM